MGSFLLVILFKCCYAEVNISINSYFMALHIFMRSRDSVVGIATSYGLDDWEVGVPSPGGVKNFLFSRSSRPALRSIQPTLQWVQGALSQGVKRPGREVDQSPPTSAQVKKMWIYTSAPPYAFMAWYLISWAQGQLYLTYFHELGLEVNLGQLRKNTIWSVYTKYFN
jgi:hypothetical protein